MLFIDRIDTPIGRFAIVADEAGRLRATGFEENHARMEHELRLQTKRADIILEEKKNPGGLSAALKRYFAGELDAIVGLPLAIEGTEFQLSVWHALAEIPCGETRTYGQLAKRIGRPNAVRAVGLANGSNPVGVVLPCHRVIGSDGSLTGYGGGIERKAWLLAHERCVLPGTQQLALGFAKAKR